MWVSSREIMDRAWFWAAWMKTETRYSISCLNSAWKPARTLGNLEILHDGTTGYHAVLEMLYTEKVAHTYSGLFSLFK